MISQRVVIKSNMEGDLDTALIKSTCEEKIKQQLDKLNGYGVLQNTVLSKIESLLEKTIIEVETK